MDYFYSCKLRQFSDLRSGLLEQVRQSGYGSGAAIEERCTAGLGVPPGPGTS